MKQLLYTLILLCIGTYTAVAQVISPDCPPDKIEPGSWYCFRNTVNLKRQPRNVSLHIAADSSVLMIRVRIRVCITSVQLLLGKIPVWAVKLPLL